MTTHVIDTATASGMFTDHGAHVLQWRPRGTEPVVWLSDLAVFADAVAIRGGVPICFPWFGAGRSGGMTPAHGFARISEWRLNSMDDDGSAATAVFTLSSTDVTSPLFPYRYRATMTARFGADLHLALDVHNDDDVPFTYEAALHTYLHVGDATAVQVEGLTGDTFHDKVTDEETVQSGPIVIDREIDRVYRSTRDVHVVDPALDRTLTVRKGGSASTVVWNPWIDKARAMTDFGDDEWRSMVCIETANVGVDAVELAPGRSHTMWARIEVE